METIGKFEILSKLGEGAMGTVYRARDPILDRQVALKTISAELLADRESLERFRREARAAARLTHPNVVTIYELGEHRGTLFIAMELLEGLDLAQALVPFDRLTPTRKLQIVLQVCRGLDYAHKRGVVHRDVKPANVRILADGAVKLVDFGIAHLAGSSLTQAGTVLGTPSYIAPEVLRSGRVDHRADIWAVGVVLYELFSGQRPFDAPNVTALAYRIVYEPLRPFDAAGLGLAPALAEIVARALAKNPTERYQQIAELAEALAPLAGVAADPHGVLSAAEREREAAERVAEARRLIERCDLEGALAAARRAQAVAPSLPDVLALIDEIEQQLKTGATMVLPSGTLEALPRPTPASAPLDVELLRARGAAAVADLGVFGESPGTGVACLSPVAEILAAAGTDGAVRIWDLAARTRTLTLRSDVHRRSGHEGAVVALAFSPDGTLVASGHVDGAVRIWQLGSGEELPVRLRHDASVGALAFSPDGGRLITGGVDAVLKVWDVVAARSGDARRELLRQPASVTSVAFARDGTLILTGHSNRVVRVLDGLTLRLVASLRGHEGAVSLLCPAPAGPSVATASPDRTVRLFDLETCRETVRLECARRPIASLGFLPDGRALVSVALDNAVTIWDLERAAPLATLWGARDESLVGVGLLRDGRRLVAALGDGRIRLWGTSA
jgi:tRNA A-37 threonylcarbamoyl transferase component Bud32